MKCDVGWAVLTVSKRFAGIGIGPRGRRVGLLWLAGDRWRFGRLAITVALGARVVVVGLGEWDDGHHVWGVGPLNVSVHSWGAP